MEFLFNQQIDTHHHHHQQQQQQPEQHPQQEQNQQSRRQRFEDRQQLVEDDYIEQQCKRIKLINHDERDLMFQVYQPWVLKTYGDNTKTKTITLKKQNRIINALKGFETNKYDSSKFKFWVKSKGFRDSKPTQFRELSCISNKAFNNSCLLYVPNVTNSGIEEYKKVAVVECFFDIIYNVHESLENNLGRHAGQKRTYRTITKSYSFLPREAVTKFLSLCSECKTTDRSIALRTPSEVIEIESDDNSEEPPDHPPISMDESKKAVTSFDTLESLTKANCPTSTSSMDNSTLTSLYLNLLEIYKQQAQLQQPSGDLNNSINPLVNYYQLLKNFYDNPAKESNPANSDNQITSTVDLTTQPAAHVVTTESVAGRMDDVEISLPVHHINTVTPVYQPDTKKIVINSLDVSINVSASPSTEFKFSCNSTPPKKRFNHFNQTTDPIQSKTAKIERKLNFDPIINESNLINFKCFDGPSPNKLANNKFSNPTDPNEQHHQQQQKSDRFPFYNLAATATTTTSSSTTPSIASTGLMINNNVAKRNDKTNHRRKGDNNNINNDDGDDDAVNDDDGDDDVGGGEGGGDFINLLNVNGNVTHKFSSNSSNGNHPNNDNNQSNDINNAVLVKPITSTYLQLTRSMGLTDDDALNLESVEPVSSAVATSAAAVVATTTSQIGPTSQQPPPDTSDPTGPNLDDTYAGLLKDADKLKLMLLAWNYQNSNAVRNGTDGPDLNTMTGLWQQYQTALGLSNKTLAVTSNEQAMSVDIQDDTNSLDQKDDDDGSEDDSDDRNDLMLKDPERLKAFNMFVRLFVDENLDRMIPISKQPKEKIQAIIDSCTRQFPEFTDRSRKRIRTYLKSCRRNKKTREGWDCNAARPTPAHLTSVQAEQILAMACENESMNAKRMRIGLEPISQVNTNAPEVSSAPSLFATSVITATKTSADVEPTVAGSLLTTVAKTSPVTVSTNSNAQPPQSDPTNGLSNYAYTTDLNSSFSARTDQYQSLLASSVNTNNNNNNNNNNATVTSLPTSATDLSMKRQLLPHKLNTAEIVAVKQLVTGYRESAAFLMRSADELENLLIQQQ